MKSTFKGLKRTTPFPNVLIDEVMPRLKDTSWRVLCVIVRQTLGWHDEKTGRRKEYDWLTRSQLKARTGRNSEAIAQAIDALVRQGYVITQNSEGMPLKTPVERRKNNGRIYYGLTESWQRRIGLLKEHRKSEQLPVLAEAIFHEHSNKTEHGTGGNANTTKETDTKKESPFSLEVMSFIEVFQKKAQEYAIEPNVVLSADAHDRLLRWLCKTDEVIQIKTLQKYFYSKSVPIIRQNYSLNAFANLCSILRVDQFS